MTRLLVLSALFVIVLALLGSVGLWWYSPVFGARPEMYKVTYQFLLVAVVGGAASLLYAEAQKKRLDHETCIRAQMEQDRKSREDAQRQEALELQATQDRLQSLRDKKRERNRQLAGELFHAYGEFFAVWKLWHHALDGKAKSPIPLERQELFKRATAAEGKFETLLINVASSIKLSNREAVNLGRLRQGFQQLRERIRDNEGIPWNSSDSCRYTAFKRLNTELATLLSRGYDSEGPNADDAHCAVVEITSNRHEDCFKHEQNWTKEGRWCAD